MRAGVCGAFRSWSLEKLWKSFFFESIATLLHTVEVATSDDRHGTAHALACIAGVTADRSRRWCIGWLRMTVTESFLVGFSQTSHRRLGYYNTLATVYLFLKSDKNWLQTKPTKTTKSLLVTIGLKFNKVSSHYCSISNDRIWKGWSQAQGRRFPWKYSKR